MIYYHGYQVSSCAQGLREMVEILESSKNTLEMELSSVNELKEKVTT